MNFRLGSCLTAFVALIGATVLPGCGSQQQAPPPPPPVAVTSFITGARMASYFDEYPATITPLNEVQIFPQVSGYITGIYFKDGQYVSKGQRLYTVDQQQYRAGYDQSVANLNVARANLARAQQDADRYQELAKKDAIAKQVVDHAMADLQTARMQVAAAQANVRSVQTGLRYSNITAPLSGTIGISQVKMGAAVSPGQTLLNTISANDPMAVDVNVDEKDIPRFVRLQQSGGKNGDSTFSLILPDGSAFNQRGTIVLIDRAVDPLTGTIKVRLSFPNPGGMLKPGMSATVRILNNSGHEEIMIPYKGVIEQMGEYFVYVLNKDTAAQRPVKLGKRIGQDIIVDSGLQKGEVIAIEGIQKLKDGAAVNATPAGK